MSEEIRRPPAVSGLTYKTKMNCGTIFTTVNLPTEVIIRMGKAGGCQQAWIETVGRLISLALQYGAPPEEISKRIRGIRCPYGGVPVQKPGQAILSCPDAISKDIDAALDPLIEDFSSPKNNLEGSLVYRDSLSDLNA